MFMKLIVLLKLNSMDSKQDLISIPLTPKILLVFYQGRVLHSFFFSSIPCKFLNCAIPKGLHINMWHSTGFRVHLDNYKDHLKVWSAIDGSFFSLIKIFSVIKILKDYCDPYKDHTSRMKDHTSHFKDSTSQNDRSLLKPVKLVYSACGMEWNVVCKEKFFLSFSRHVIIKKI